MPSDDRSPTVTIHSMFAELFQEQVSALNITPLHDAVLEEYATPDHVSSILLFQRCVELSIKLPDGHAPSSIESI